MPHKQYPVILRVKLVNYLTNHPIKLRVLNFEKQNVNKYKFEISEAQNKLFNTEYNTHSSSDALGCLMASFRC